MNGINPYSFLSGWGSFAQGSAWPAQQVTIINLPQNLTALKQPLQIKGEIATQNADGTTLIKTPQGDFTVKLPTSLPNGTKIDLQIPSGQSPREAFIQPRLTQSLSSENVQNQRSGTPISTTAPTETIVTNTARPQSNQDVKTLQNTTQQASQSIAQKGDNLAPTPIQVGQAVRITVLPPALQSLAAIAREFIHPQSLQIDGRVNPKITSATLSLPGVSTLPSQALSGLQIRQLLSPSTMTYQVSGDRTLNQITTKFALPDFSATATIPITVKSADATAPSHLAAPFSGTNDFRVLKVTEPMHIRPPILTSGTVSLSATMTAVNNSRFENLTLLNSFAGESIATATGFITNDGHPVLQVILPGSQAQMVSVNYPARHLPAGTHITLSPIVGQQSSLIPTSGISPQYIDDVSLKSIPQQQLQALLDILPSATNPRQFPAAAILFLAAAKGGDLSAWIGKRPLRSLESIPHAPTKSGVEKLLADLLKNGAGIQRKPSAADPLPTQNGDWKGYQIPLLSGMDIHHPLLWVKDRHTGTQQEQKTDTGTRFIVDLRLSRMGTVQFDGLVNAGRKTLDLSFITQRDLTKPMQDTVKNLWYNALENIDYSGKINFRKLSE